MRPMAYSGQMRFLGVDLGWYGKPSGVAALAWSRGALRICSLDRLSGMDAILRWVEQEAGTEDAVAAVDAPLVIANETGSRPVDRQMTSAYGRFHAGCHAANRRRPFAALTSGFAAELERRGFRHAPLLRPRQPGRYQIEVHPHAATIELFRLDRIVKYKKGPFAARAKELARLRALMLERLPRLDPPLAALGLPELPEQGLAALKAVEDRLDAVMAAYIGAWWWHRGAEGSRVFGSAAEGYVVVPAGS